MLDDVEATATDLLGRIVVTTTDGAAAWAYHCAIAGAGHVAHRPLGDDRRALSGSAIVRRGYGGDVHASAVRHQHRVGESVVAALIFAVVTVAVAGIGSVATSSGRDWYDTLEKPGFTPPDATFGIVWTILYVAIAVAGWLAWRASVSARPTMWWAIQMGLNLALDDGVLRLESPVGGVVVIAALIAAVAMNLRESARVDTTAGVLLFPYLIWCCFAAALTVGVASSIGGSR